jgi:hypothetical protein
MSDQYDRRDAATRTAAGIYDRHLSQATALAKGYWGSGWDKLTSEMRIAFVCKYLAGILGNLDFEATFEGTTDTERKLISRLVDLCSVLHEAQLS